MLIIIIPLASSCTACFGNQSNVYTSSFNFIFVAQLKKCNFSNLFLIIQ